MQWEVINLYDAIWPTAKVCLLNFTVKPTESQSESYNFISLQFRINQVGLWKH